MGKRPLPGLRSSHALSNASRQHLQLVSVLCECETGLRGLLTRFGGDPSRGMRVETRKPQGLYRAPTDMAWLGENATIQLGSLWNQDRLVSFKPRYELAWGRSWRSGAFLEPQQMDKLQDVIDRVFGDVD